VPRYYFVLHGPDGEVHDDDHGTELPDKTLAFAYAERIVGELKDAGGYDEPGWAMIIREGSEGEIALLPFSRTLQHH
jgi:hypothetical protein